MTQLNLEHQPETMPSPSSDRFKEAMSELGSFMDQRDLEWQTGHFGEHAKDLYDNIMAQGITWPPAVIGKLGDGDMSPEGLLRLAMRSLISKDLTEALPGMSSPEEVSDLAGGGLEVIPWNQDSYQPNIYLFLQYRSGIKNPLDPKKMGLPGLKNVAAMEIVQQKSGLRGVRCLVVSENEEDENRPKSEWHELLVDEKGELKWYSPEALSKFGVAWLGSPETELNLGENARGAPTRPLSINLSENRYFRTEDVSSTILVPKESHVPEIKSRKPRRKGRAILAGLALFGAGFSLSSGSSDSSSSSFDTLSASAIDDLRTQTEGKLPPEKNIDLEEEFTNTPESAESEKRFNEAFRAFFDNDSERLRELAEPSLENRLPTDPKLIESIKSAESIDDVYKIFNGNYGQYIELVESSPEDREYISEVITEKNLEDVKTYVPALMNIINTFVDTRMLYIPESGPKKIQIVFGARLNSSYTNDPAGIAVGIDEIILDVDSARDPEETSLHELIHFIEELTELLNSSSAIKLFNADVVGYHDYEDIPTHNSLGQPAVRRDYGFASDDEGVATTMDKLYEGELPTTSEGPLWEKFRLIMSWMENEAPGYTAGVLSHLLEINPKASELPSEEELRKRAEDMSNKLFGSSKDNILTTQNIAALVAFLSLFGLFGRPTVELLKQRRAQNRGADSVVDPSRAQRILGIK